MTWLAFIVGLLIGIFAGALILGLCVAAKSSSIEIDEVNVVVDERP